MRKNIDRIKLAGATNKEDFEVVSKYIIDKDSKTTVYGNKDNVEIMRITHTPFPEELIDYVYDVEGEVDIDLAVTLGLGVLRGYADGKLFIYNPNVFLKGEERLHDDVLKLGLYYQITHPEYVDTRLDILFHSKGIREHLKRKMFIKDESVLDRLEEIFQSQKGSKDNVIQFPR